MAQRLSVLLLLGLLAIGLTAAGTWPMPQTRAQSEAVAATPKQPAAANAVKNPVVVSPKKDAEAEKPPLPAKELRHYLSQPTDKLQTGIDKGTPLKDALDFIFRIHEVRPGETLKYRIDGKAFADVGEPNIYEKQIELVPMPKVPLAVILDDLLGRIDPPEARGTFRVVGDYVEITTRIKVESGTLLEQLVDVDLDKRSLESGLQDLMDKNGVTIVLDGSLGEKAKMPISAVFHRVSLKTVVRLLANMADLDVVLVENMLYVTTKEKAAQLEQDNPRWQKNGGAGA